MYMADHLYAMCIWRVICSYILLLIFGSFIPYKAVPATNIVVCNKVRPYSGTVFLSSHMRSVNTCAKRERCRHKSQRASLTDCSQYYNHRVWQLSQLLFVLFHKPVSLQRIFSLYIYFYFTFKISI